MSIPNDSMNEYDKVIPKVTLRYVCDTCKSVYETTVKVDRFMNCRMIGCKGEVKRG